MRVDYPSYATLKELSAASSVIAQVKVSSTVRSSTLLPDGATSSAGGLPVTLRPSTVTQVLAGRVQVGQTINLSRPGLPDEQVEGMAEVEPNREYLLFLDTYPDGRATISGGDEGIFEPSSDGTTYSSAKFGTVSEATIRASKAGTSPS